MLISLTESTKILTFGDLLIPIGQFQYAEADSDSKPMMTSGITKFWR